MEKKKRKYPFEKYTCKIDSCKKFNTCDKVQVRGKNVKCMNYERPF